MNEQQYRAEHWTPFIREEHSPCYGTCRDCGEPYLLPDFGRKAYCPECLDIRVDEENAAYEAELQAKERVQ